jgi:hypothetical protein
MVTYCTCLRNELNTTIIIYLRSHPRLKSSITNPRVMGGAAPKARKSPKVRTVPKSAKDLEAQNSRRLETEARIQGSYSMRPKNHTCHLHVYQS